MDFKKQGEKTMSNGQYFRATLGIVVKNNDEPVKLDDLILYEVIRSDRVHNDHAYDCAAVGTRGTLTTLEHYYPRTNFRLNRPLTAVNYHTGQIATIQ